jgi:hypothetical protein
MSVLLRIEVFITHDRLSRLNPLLHRNLRTSLLDYLNFTWVTVKRTSDSAGRGQLDSCRIRYVRLKGNNGESKQCCAHQAAKTQNLESLLTGQSRCRQHGLHTPRECIEGADVVSLATPSLMGEGLVRYNSMVCSDPTKIVGCQQACGTAKSLN